MITTAHCPKQYFFIDCLMGVALHIYGLYSEGPMKLET